MDVVSCRCESTTGNCWTCESLHPRGWFCVWTGRMRLLRTVNSLKVLRWPMESFAHTSALWSHRSWNVRRGSLVLLGTHRTEETWLGTKVETDWRLPKGRSSSWKRFCVKSLPGWDGNWWLLHFSHQDDRSGAQSSHEVCKEKTHLVLDLSSFW